MTTQIYTSDQKQLRTELSRLIMEHRDLDDAIRALESSTTPDLIQLQRLKKKKLLLKDRIKTIEDQLIPDIIA